MAFIKQAKALGCKIIVVAKESFKDDDWPRDSIDELYFMPNLAAQPDITYAVSYLARSNAIDQIIALDDYDVETAGHLREHFRLPGIGDSLARHFRDKLAMRTCARQMRIRVPEFTGVFNYDRLREFMARVPAPYVLKPRSEASSMGIKKINHPDEIWPLLDAQGDQQSYFHLEQFVAGDVYHVDSLIDEGEVFFAQAHKYGMPPMSVYQGGGVFFTRSIDRHTPEAEALFEFNKQLLIALGHPRGASHAEYIKSHADGQWYFLECAARVGGANIAEAVEYATGINLWAEWAKIEVAFVKGEKYQRPNIREGYSGVINCLAKQEWPDLSVYDDPEVMWRMKKKQHAGLVVASPDAARVETLLTSYAERFAHDFLMVLPPRDKPAP
jgi:biotin carboxylase